RHVVSEMALVRLDEVAAVLEREIQTEAAQHCRMLGSSVPARHELEEAGLVLRLLGEVDREPRVRSLEAAMHVEVGSRAVPPLLNIDVRSSGAIQVSPDRVDLDGPDGGG